MSAVARLMPSPPARVDSRKMNLEEPGRVNFVYVNRRECAVESVKRVGTQKDFGDLLEPQIPHEPSLHTTHRVRCSHRWRSPAPRSWCCRRCGTSRTPGWRSSPQ